MENHQSECNFLSTVSIFSSPPLAARCPLSPLLPAAAALSFCLPLPSPSPLLPLSLASAVISFPPLSPLLSSPSPLSRLCCHLLPLYLASVVLSFPPLSRLRCPLLPLSRLRCRVRRVTTRRPPLSASLCPPLYFSLHFLPFLPPPLSFLPPFNDFLHFFVAVLPFSSAVCAFSATNVEFSHPPLRDKLVASPIPLHFPSLSPRSLHLPLSASLRPPPPP